MIRIEDCRSVVFVALFVAIGTACGTLGKRAGDAAAIDSSPIESGAVDSTCVEGVAAKQRSRAEVACTLERQWAAFDYHYQQARRKNPQLAGQIDVLIDIDPAGRVRNVSVVSDEPGEPFLTRAIIQEIEAMDFGPAATNARMPYSLNFTP